MKDKIEQLAKGKFEYQQPELLLSTEKILIRAEAGKIFRGSFRISNSKKRRMKGVLYSDSRMFRLEKEQFVGEENEIPFVFHGENVKAGETYEGNLQIITDAGETKLPYEIQVVFPCFQTSIGEVKDLFQFASLAKSDWEEAESLFFNSDFPDTIFYHDSKYRLLYQVLSTAGRQGKGEVGMDMPASINNSMAMEEFLVAADKKMPVDIALEKEEFSYKAGTYNFMDKLVLRKTGWGYAAFQVECDAAFIGLERNSFTAGDFVNGRLEIGFVIRADGMKNGIHSAKIRIFSVKKQMEATVTCHMEWRRKDQQQWRLRKKHAVAGLAENYLMFRSGRKDAGLYIKEAEKMLAVFRQEEIGKGRQDLLARFYQIHIWQASGKEAAAKNALAVLAEREEEEEIAGYPELRAGLYYLLAMQKKPVLSAEKAAERIRPLYQQNPEQWLLLWYLLYLDKAYQNPKDRYEAIRQHAGNSPVLFFEALAVLREDPSLLCRLEKFEQRLMQFAVDYHYFTEELLGQLAYLAAKEKSMSPALYRVLVRGYEQMPSKELLHVICTLIIRNGEKSPRYFQWLGRGVKEQLRITQLMEYYIACMPEDSEEAIHPNVYLYFTYQNKMNSRRKALLYASLIRHQQEYPDIYRNYRKQIEEFALDQICVGAISRNLAVIYDEVFAEGFSKEEDYQYLPDVAFSCELTCRLESIESVSIAYSEGIGECVMPILQQKAIIPLYTEDAEVFLVDKSGIYYPLKNFWKGSGEGAGKATVHLEKLLHLEKHLWKAYEKGGAQIPLLLCLKERADVSCQEGEEDGKEQRLGVYKRLIGHPEAPAELKSSCVHSLLDHSYAQLEDETLKYYLKMVSPRGLERKARARLINLLLKHRLDEEAYAALWDYGTDGVEASALSGLIVRRQGKEPEEFLLELAQYAFAGGDYEEEVLSYLCRYYHGSTRQMFDIWNAARKAEMDTESLEESLLGQMVFTENFVGNAQAVFMNYYRHGTNHKLIRAYLSYFAHKYLTRNWIVSPEMFDVMGREVALEDNKAYTLALLKAYSAEEQLTERQIAFVSGKLQQLLQSGILLPFYCRFNSIIKLPEGVCDKYYVEYHADPESRVRIYYRFEGEEKYHEAEMEDASYGIFVSSFILFGGEGMQYYITEEREGQAAITESATVTLDERTLSGQYSRYDTLNMIISAYKKQDAVTTMDLLEHYIRTAYQAGHIFTPIP